VAVKEKWKLIKEVPVPEAVGTDTFLYFKKDKKSLKCGIIYFTFTDKWLYSKNRILGYKIWRRQNEKTIHKVRARSCIGSACGSVCFHTAFWMRRCGGERRGRDDERGDSRGGADACRGNACFEK
jgi:hypothetical protein